VIEAIDTTTALGQCFFQITGAFAELERNLMRERTMAGLASARRRAGVVDAPKASITTPVRWRFSSTRPTRALSRPSAPILALRNARFIVTLRPIGPDNRSEVQ
jgi:resolvase-like protein